MRFWYGAQSCVAEVTQAKGFHVGLPRKRGTSDARALNGNGFDTKVPECFAEFLARKQGANWALERAPVFARELSPVRSASSPRARG